MSAKESSGCDTQLLATTGHIHKNASPSGLTRLLSLQRCHLTTPSLGRWHTGVHGKGHALKVKDLHGPDDPADKASRRFCSIRVSC